MSAADACFMARALELGRRGQGATWPNPPVGCVIVADGTKVGEGTTAPYGRPHAEVQALAQAGGRAKGATAYVTLEPCAHYGQTPPCCDALIAAGVTRVVACLQDSDPRVAGAGFARLRAAGVTVETGLMADEAARDLAGFFSRIERGRPRVTLKLAMSLDGRIATGSGHSQWITGAAARHEVHLARARHDAVMVGGGTARADDPALTARGVEILRPTVRIVVSRKLDLPLSSQLGRSAGEAPVWLCHGPDADPALIDAWTGLGAHLISCDLTGRLLDTAAVLQALGRTGLTSVLCEGGGALAASLLAADCVDELMVFTAGLAIGAEGLPGIGALGLARLDEAARFDLIECRAIDGDILHRWAR